MASNLSTKLRTKKAALASQCTTVFGVLRCTSHTGRPLLRSFSSSTRSCLRTSELAANHYKSLRVNSDRLWKDIHSTAEYGIGKRYGEGAEQTGVSRLTLSEEDSKVRQWFVDTTKALGCEVTTDNIGNCFAIRPGLRNDVPATFVGSHLDTQPTGGRFDGVLGVCAGIEMVRTLNDNWIETEGPVGVVNWTNEEGARFPCSMMGSGVWAGSINHETALDLSEVGDGNVTVKEALLQMSLLDGRPAPVMNGGIPMAGHFELHIEQGPVLQESNRNVAVVHGVQAYEWFRMNIYGAACHAGTTPLANRRDPLLFAANFITGARKLACMKEGLVTFGCIKASPSSINTVPDRVELTIDIRHRSDDGLANLKEALLKSTSSDINVEFQSIFKSPATKFSPLAIEMISKSITNNGTEPFEMISGAGHDSVNASKHCPTAMVFVPCKDGVSHHPAEWANKQDCATGADVIVESVLRFDKWRHENDFSTMVNA